MGLADRYPERVFFRLSSRNKRRLETLAYEQGVTMSDYVRLVVQKKIKRELNKNANKNK